MSIHISLHELTPLLAIAAGISVLVWPKLMRYILGAYLIAIGIIELLN